MKYVTGLDNVNDWDEYSSDSPASMGLTTPDGYMWSPEEDQGDGGSSFFLLFRLSPWNLVLKIYPHYTKAESDWVRDGVEVKLADGTSIFKAKRIKDTNKYIMAYIEGLEILKGLRNK